VVSLILWSLILIIIDLADITYYIGRETIIPREDIPACGYGGNCCSRSCSVTPNARRRGTEIEIQRYPQ
jgi:hypothetical protein